MQPVPQLVDNIGRVIDSTGHVIDSTSAAASIAIKVLTYTIAGTIVLVSIGQFVTARSVEHFFIFSMITQHRKFQLKVCYVHHFA